MAMLCYVLAALCLVYCVGVVATKAAGTKFYLIWLAGTALFGLFGFLYKKGSGCVCQSDCGRESACLQAWGLPVCAVCWS